MALTKVNNDLQDVLAAAQPTITSVGTLTGFTSTGIDDNATSNAITIDASERVGINTVSPTHLLQISGGSTDGRMSFTNNARGNGQSDGMWVGVDSTQSYLLSRGAFPLTFYTNATERMKIDSAGEIILSAGFQLGELRIHANQITSGFNVDGEDRDVWINYTGYAGGTTRYRDFRVGNGKQQQIVFVDGSASSVAITGSLSVSSSFSKGSGSFKIDHPLPAKTETHNLVHSFIEGPQADNIYRGKVDLVDGSATVNIDTVSGMSEGTYVLLNTNTQCFTSNESGWTAVKGSVSGNILTIEAQESCSDTISWMVVGERHDQHMLDTAWTDENGKVIVEPLKEVESEEEAV